MAKPEPITSQDWYRVRRGEDEIAWGRIHTDPAHPQAVFSRRSFQEAAFFTAEQKEEVDACIASLSELPVEEQGVPVEHGGDRRIVYASELKIIFRYREVTGQLEISTIRGGKVVDPENVMPQG